MQLTDFQADAERFSTELAREAYRLGAGLKATSETSALYERHDRIFAIELVRDLVAARQEGRIARFLAEFAAIHYLRTQVLGPTDQIERRQAMATVRWDEQTIDLRSATAVLADEPDTARRHSLERLILAESAKLQSDRQKRLHILHEAAEHLDFPTYAALCDDLRGLDLKELSSQSTTLLQRSGQRYFAEFDEILWSVGATAGEATPADLVRLARAEPFDEVFPKDDLLPTLNRTLVGLGIDHTRQPSLSLDVEPRPLKSPWAFCTGIRVPAEVRLVVFPRGGLGAYRALLHAGGHAEHFVHVDASLPFAFRQLGDRSLVEAYAYLLEGLIGSPDWLRLVLGRRSPEDYGRLVRFLRCWAIRRDAARLAYAQELHGSGRLPEMPDRYRAILGAALGYRHHPEQYLSDVEDAFAVAQRLRARVFEAQLRAYLVREYGEGWFTRRSAGDVVRDLWTRGQRCTADDVAKELGYAGLDAEPLLKELE